MHIKPLLVLAWGNRSRGDDATGPLFLDALGHALGDARALRVELLEEHQLHPETALDLIGRTRVLLVDADPQAAGPFSVAPVAAAPEAQLTSHALSPPALLAVYQQLYDRPAPPVTLLGLRAARFGLGLALSPAAAQALPEAVQWALGWIDGR